MGINKVHLPNSVTIPFRDKFKIRYMKRTFASPYCVDVRHDVVFFGK